jgi:molybdopterin molybdotransferase
LLESFGFEVIFSQVPIRPGRPLIFGVDGNRVAFGLPGNPLSHFVCFHLFVAAALAKLSGGGAKPFVSGRLGVNLDEASNPRETLWPARWGLNTPDGHALLYPLKWSSSGDLTCLAGANALMRIPPNCRALVAGAEMVFLSTNEPT